ncbi:hypothetical protein AUC47_04890 [Microbacterium sp. SZ1]|uniref:hypothetical protein n=1 Tax=Microbacterium sp. SZ1 TaxID=1849736 RepID=UPI000BBBE15D|nr:hypothetical protein [Microbacterium sp. SZ1]PCE13987.1 hypothetical protein AUC47_04890 [Microbacterium sp. SZ1]
MADPILKTPIVSVIIEQDDKLVEYVVQTDNRDAVAWDMHRNRVNWPAGTDAPMLWMTYLAWCAMRRDTSTPAAKLTFDQFNDAVRGISSAKPADEQEPVDPTHAGAEPA